MASSAPEMMTRSPTPPAGTASPRLRVLYVMHNAAPGGCAKSLLHMIEHLPAGSVEAHVACPQGPAVESFRRAGVRIHPLAGVSMLTSNTNAPLRGPGLLYLGRTLWSLRHGPALGRLIDALRPDLVHLNESGMLQAALLARRRGIPVVMHARGVAAPEPRWARRLIDGMISRWTDRVIAIDQSVARSLSRIEQVEVVYNPLPVRPSDVADPQSAPAGTDASPRAIKRITFLGNLLAYKGIWDLLEAARMLRDRQDLQFVIVGGNSRPAAFYRSWRARFMQRLGFARDVEAEVRRWVADEGMGDRIELAGHVDDIVKVLRQTDILVFPSHLDGAGRSVFEAGVLGKPAIVTLRHRVEDIVEHGRTGLILPERDPGALAAAIRQLADRPADRAAMGEAARRKYAVQFDPARVASDLHRVYRSLARNESGR